MRLNIHSRKFRNCSGNVEMGRSFSPDRNHD